LNPITIRLSIMMFLQFFIWGGWFVTLGTFLGAAFSASGGEIGQAYSTQSWGAIIAPFIVGLIADRFFNAERLLGVLHLVGAVLMYLMYSSGSFAAFYPYVLGYMIIYMPTLALVNSVSFRQLADPSAQFGKIRVWGTIGWIIAGLVISMVGWDAQQAVAGGALRNTFLLCSVTSLILGLYSFTLPATPPVRETSQNVVSQALGLDALRLLKDRNFAVFFLSSVLICIPLAFYYQNTNLFLAEIGVTNPTGKMTIGQMSEVLFMLLLPVFLHRYGIKKTLLIGMAAWVLRYVLFAFGTEGAVLWLLIGGIALHGVCYDFFFVSGQIYTDSKAGEQYKSSAQGLITLATYGVGMLIGFKVAGLIYDQYAVAGGHDWKAIWLVPAAFAAAVFVLFALTFKPESIQRSGT
jgi:nucleoside transporter